jgi:hypothetical protein
MDMVWNAGSPTSSVLGSTQNYIDLLGGNVNYQVKYDSVSNKLWTLVNANRYKYYTDQRSEVYLASSSDQGLTWNYHGKVMGFNATVSDWQTVMAKNAVQYTSFEIFGNDIIAVARTANSSALNYHDANIISMYKVVDFRSKAIQTFVAGAMIIDENSERLEDVNGIAVIRDRSINHNSPFMLSADNASKPNWVTNGIQFNGTTDYLRMMHEKTLSLSNGTGISLFVVIENLQSIGTTFVLSNDDGVVQSNTALKGGWWLSPTGMGIEGRYGDYSDLTLGNNYILASSFDKVNSHIWNYKNGVNRGDPASKVGTTWITDRLVMAGAYSGTNYKEVWIGRRNIGATKLYFNSKIRALHIVPKYMTPAEMVSYQTALNATYGIY